MLSESDIAAVISECSALTPDGSRALQELFGESLRHLPIEHVRAIVTGTVNHPNNAAWLLKPTAPAPNPAATSFVPSQPDARSLANDLVRASNRALDPHAIGFKPRSK